jgi:tRNA dimethylallyltransferase
VNTADLLRTPKLIVLGGPTASGKTMLALKLAERLDGEIISADSQQVYRYFDIGTAKPTRAQLAQVPHHLISIVEPDAPFSAAEFQGWADRAIAAIQQRGKRVLVVGGTGLYLRALLHGLISAPGADALLRARLADEAAREGTAALHRRLAKVDPKSAAQVSPTDLVRIIRALEIHQSTGIPASEYRGQHRFASERYPFALYVLAPPREELYRTIDQRAGAMFVSGLLEEVRDLVSRGFRDASPMQGINYAQALEVIEGRISVEEGIRLAAQQARRYAKRQFTWFRREPRAVPLQPPYTELESAGL